MAAAPKGKESEKGVCIICGGMHTGTPAKPEIPIRAARWLRAALKQPAKHTIACKEHIDEARQKRAKYEKKLRDYLLFAILFFIFMIFGSFAFGGGSLWIAMPAVLGTAFIAMLPQFYYFPSFEN